MYYTGMFNTILHIVWHAIQESIITLPILFICYLLIELLEERILNKYKKNKKMKSLFSPVVSAGFGLIPQCGFSVVASDLFSKRIITIGSLFAILIATSDEALPILLANPANYGSLAIIIGVKFIYAIIVGVSIDAISKAIKKSKSKKLSSTNNLQVKVSQKEIEVVENKKHEHKNHEHDHEKHEHSHDDHSHEHNEEIEVHGCCKHNLEKSNNKLKDLFVHPLLHSLKIFIFILVINIVFGALVEFVGENAISNFMSSTGFFEPFIVAIAGLIPNCAASVIITELFLVGGISIGSCIAGLCINSGLALIMLFKLNKNFKQNILILISLYSLSCLLGIIVNLF